MTLYAIGEALIDFVPNQTGKPHEEMSYQPKVGGAPLNVACAFTKLGGKAQILTQVGADDFGNQIIDLANKIGVQTDFLKISEDAKTGLAFVSLLANGERSFSFYRQPSADMLYSPDFIQEIQPKENDILHFCSVSLLPNYPMRDAHLSAIKRFRDAGALISFDVNLRFPLWNNPDDLYRAVWDFLPLADVVKISDDELPFLLKRRTRPEEALSELFQGAVQTIIYTAGKDGASAYFRSGKSASCAGFQVEAIDATGAGDAFIATYLYYARSETPEKALRLACGAGALTTLKRGAVNGMPTASELLGFV